MPPTARASDRRARGTPPATSRPDRPTHPRKPSSSSRNYQTLLSSPCSRPRTTSTVATRSASGNSPEHQQGSARSTRTEETHRSARRSLSAVIRLARPKPSRRTRRSARPARRKSTIAASTAGTASTRASRRRRFHRSACFLEAASRSSSVGRLAKPAAVATCRRTSPAVPTMKKMSRRIGRRGLRGRRYRSRRFRRKAAHRPVPRGNGRRAGCQRSRSASATRSSSIIAHRLAGQAELVRVQPDARRHSGGRRAAAEFFACGEEFRHYRIGRRSSSRRRLAPSPRGSSRPRISACKLRRFSGR